MRDKQQKTDRTKFNRVVDYAIPILGSMFATTIFIVYKSAPAIPALVCGATIGIGLKYFYGDPSVKKLTEIERKEESDRQRGGGQEPDLQQHPKRGISLLSCRRVKSETIAVTPKAQER